MYLPLSVIYTHPEQLQYKNIARALELRNQVKADSGYIVTKWVE